MPPAHTAALRALDAALKVPARAVRVAEVLLAYGHGKPTQLPAGSGDFPPFGVALSGNVGIFEPKTRILIPDNHRDPGLVPPEMRVADGEGEAEPGRAC